MLTLDELVEQTDAIFEKEKHLSNRDIERRIEAYQEARLTRQTFNARVSLAEDMGFVKMTGKEAAARIMGENPNKIKKGWLKQRVEYLYDHYTDEVYTTWVNKPTRFIKRKFLFSKRWEVWEVALNYVECTIPYGIVLRMQEVKALHAFNAFSVVAPKGMCLAREKLSDPILLGHVYEMPRGGDGQPHTSGNEEKFFLARWE
jgi:hypothetical protein